MYQKVNNYWFKANPINPLAVESGLVKHYARKSTGLGAPSSSGVSALKKVLLPVDEYQRAMKMKKEELLEFLENEYPNINFKIRYNRVG